MSINMSPFTVGSKLSTQINELNDILAQIPAAVSSINAYVEDDSSSGEGSDAHKSYLSEGHIPFLESLQNGLDVFVKANETHIQAVNAQLPPHSHYDQGIITDTLIWLDESIRKLDYMVNVQQQHIFADTLRERKRMKRDWDDRRTRLETYLSYTNAIYASAETALQVANMKLMSLEYAVETFTGNTFSLPTTEQLIEYIEYQSMPVEEFLKVDYTCLDSVQRKLYFGQLDIRHDEIVEYYADMYSVSFEHARIIFYAKKWSDVPEYKWTTIHFLAWQVDKKITDNNGYVFIKKAGFISNYADVIRDAAERFDIPEFLLAGVAFTEFGGMPTWLDDVAHPIRSFDWSGPDWVDENLTLTRNPELTSFGNTSIQLRRAYEMLGYNNPSINQENKTISSLKDPIVNIYMAAMHLDVLRDVDFVGKSAEQLTKEEIMTIASRYNLGPDVSREEAESYSYGKSIYGNQERIEKALNR